MQIPIKCIGYFILGAIAILAGANIAFFGPVFSRGFHLSPFAGILIIGIGIYYLVSAFLMKNKKKDTEEDKDE